MISSILSIIVFICLWKGFLKYCDKHDTGGGIEDQSAMINQIAFFNMMNDKE